MAGIEFNDDAIAAFEAEIKARAAATEGKFPIPVDASVEEIEKILTAQLESAGFTPDPAGVHEKAVEVHASLQDGEA
ncbi:hypothetical protein ABC337_15260 [Arthrobacter sp. 1P04PC]|uniref:hypothetical protein n=1 Tax=unclassified Arthrobacter TaxID=235627 RepID=UPI0039A2C7EC